MSGMGELLSVQTPLVQTLAENGWDHVPGDQLGRPDEDPFATAEVEAALVRLNPAIAEEPERVHEVLRRLRTLPLTALESGLAEANQDFAAWLKGEITHEYVGTKGSVPVRLIDFENPANNTYIVSEEVRYGTPGHIARFDVVLWVNGFPLVVGELKTPLQKGKSWATGARELVDTYQPGWAPFFVSNVLCFATEGKQYRYAGVGTPLQHWYTWGAVSDQPRLSHVLETAASMLTPDVVLDFLQDFSIFEASQSAAGSLNKLLARYTQYEAVNRIVERVKDPDKRKGLIYHTQGSGKTLAMVFAAGKLLRDPELKNPTIVLVADRVQLVQQLWDQFRTTSMPRLQVPGTAAGLRSALSSDRRGLIFTTVHKFAGAGVLNTRENVVVMVDEAHRTQEGDLGQTMRAALPNANLFAFTGTPIADVDRNTFATFGDEFDPGSALHTYGTDESIRDGMTVPIHVAPRKVEFSLDKEALDQAFAVMAADENLDDEQQDQIARRASRAATFFANPERIRAVCADIVDHFYETVDPLGMKAQIVVIDRAACVAYTEELDRLLQERYERQNVAARTDPSAESPVRDEVGVVMTVGTAKGEDPAWQKYALTDAQKAALLKRFRTFDDPLKFLVCTSKLGTGFNAPIEGVMYLDKPLKDHTLFQTITRANRTWRNPETDADKRYGIIVDYVGLGAGFAKAMAPANPDQVAPQIEVSGLIEMFKGQLEHMMARFAGIDIDEPGPQTLMDAQARIPGQADQERFAADYAMLEGVWESLWPTEGLRPHRGAYRFLSQVYASLQPSPGEGEHLWHRLGVKTLELVHRHMDDITVTRADEVVVADEDTVRTLMDEGLLDDPKEVEGKSADDLIDSIAQRLKKRLAGPSGQSPQFKSLAERLDRLRERTMAAAQQSIEWLREAFTLAKDLTAAEKAEDEGTLELLPDPRLGALTQIFQEYAPADAPMLVERVVKDIDAIVKQVSYDGWEATLEGDKLVRRHVRQVLRKHQLHTADGLFEKAYAYIAEHY